MKNISVIGAGIIGVSCAEHIRRSGHKVTLIDKLPPGEATSFGNAGVMASNSVLPVVMPGVWKKIPSMLLDPMGPLSVRWRYLPKALPWLWALLRNATPEKLAHTVPALAAMTRGSVEEHQQLAAGSDAHELLKPDSNFSYLYDSVADFDAEAADWEHKRELGIRFEVLRGQEVRDYEPAVSNEFPVMVVTKDTGFVLNPSELVKRYARHFEQNGGIVLQREVQDIEIIDGKVRGLVTDDGTLATDAVIVAAGAWSGKLAARLGSPVPLDTERGYHVTINSGKIPLRGPIMVVSKKYVLTPMEMGLRVAGQVEFAGLDAPPNFSRSKYMIAGAKRALPDLDTSDYTEWMGYRPTLPDSLPVVGPSPIFDNVFFAFGHHHVGLTMGPKTGRIIADLVSGRTPNIDLAPYRVDRF